MNVARKKTLLSVPIHLQSFFTVETPLFALTNYGLRMSYRGNKEQMRYEIPFRNTQM